MPPHLVFEPHLLSSFVGSHVRGYIPSSRKTLSNQHRPRSGSVRIRCESILSAGHDTLPRCLGVCLGSVHDCPLSAGMRADPTG